MTSNIDTLIFDVDDTCYTIASGFHNEIKKRICAHANATPAIRSRAGEWLGADRDFERKDLGAIFPKIVTAYKAQGEGDVEAYFDKVYGNDYRRIRPNPRLVRALNAVRERGNRIVIYSNGPSSPVPGKDYHIQKVLRRLGIAPDFVEELRRNTYDLLMSVEAGAGKPTSDGLRNFLEVMKVDRFRSVMWDDDHNMVMTAARMSLRAVWVQTPFARPVSRAEMGWAAHHRVIVVKSAAEAVETLLKNTLRPPKSVTTIEGGRAGLGPKWQDYGIK